MRIGFFSPLPPARTGVADYSAALIGAMRESGTVEVNRPGDVDLYHLGNNALHREIYRRALEEPGVVVLHDAVLNHFFLGQLDKTAYVTEFVYNYGPWTADLAARLWEGRARSAADSLYFVYPMLRRAIERSRAVIVHNTAAERIAREHGAVVVHRIPHLFEPPSFAPEREIVRLREKLGLRTSDLLLGVFGHLRETKRIPTILRAFHRVRRERDNVKLLLAGDFASRDLALALAGELDAEGVIRARYLPTGQFWQYAAASDVCLNLRWPSAGETSGIAVRLTGIGKCVVVTDGEETNEFPEGSVIRVASGPAEEEMLTTFLFWLADNPGRVREIGARAAAHIREFHTLSRVAAEYWRVMADCYHEGQSLSAVT
jgi:glycosyltransferase involved in cell wall biosynthesis